MDTWNMPAVVADEKLDFLRSILVGSKLEQYCSTSDVLAVPEEPQMSTGCLSFSSTMSMRYS